MSLGSKRCRMGMRNEFLRSQSWQSREAHRRECGVKQRECEVSE